MSDDAAIAQTFRDPLHRFEMTAALMNRVLSFDLRAGVVAHHLSFGINTMPIKKTGFAAVMDTAKTELCTAWNAPVYGPNALGLV